ncbi:Oxidoreductase, molybdopterin binding [Yersinia ruckeri ATCC 29473]|uniref:Putative sulfite oxidase n=1 Tax=Yersinia ruckeri TaxID=29486 RepID=A0A0A8VH59_YERRU|nr:Oxidoreductase, molybdopterin binding [Yersinia ruckeri ATCC 29473]CEK27279.1 putative sulfite oxidase [Yersinia ruckeri]
MLVLITLLLLGLYPQTQLTLAYDGKILPAEYGYPDKIMYTNPIGYKKPIYIQSIIVTNTDLGGFWEN